MSIPTPITAQNLLKSSNIQKIFAALDLICDAMGYNFLSNLQATPLENIWRNNTILLPPVKEAILWHAANQLMKTGTTTSTRIIDTTKVRNKKSKSNIIVLS